VRADEDRGAAPVAPAALVALAPGAAVAPWPDDAVRDPLIGAWHLWQRRRGHRTSTDDVLTAWLSVRAWRAQRGGSVDAIGDAASPATLPARYADLGCGIGSVMLMTAHALRPAFTVGVEAQAQSVTMASRTVAELPDALDVALYHGDLRAASAAALGGAFDLVTGSPPYFPVGAGTPSPDAQREACRFELRGGIEAYCEAAARVLAQRGQFVVVFQTTWDQRVLAAAAAAGLRLTRRVDVRMRDDAPGPFLSVYAFVRGAADARGAVVDPSFAIRDGGGRVTEAYRAARAELGLATTG